MIWVKALIFVDVAARVAAFVCCVGERGSRFYISAHSSPLCVMRAKSTRQGKKEALLCKIWLHHQTQASLPFLTPLPRRLTWCCSSHPMLRPTHTSATFGGRTGVSSSLSLSRSPWPPLGPVHGNLWLGLKVARSQAKPARKQNQFCLHARTNHGPQPPSRPVRSTVVKNDARQLNLVV